MLTVGTSSDDQNQPTVTTQLGDVWTLTIDVCTLTMHTPHTYVAGLGKVVHGQFVVPRFYCKLTVEGPGALCAGCPEGVEVFSLSRPAGQIAVFQNAPCICKCLCPTCCSIGKGIVACKCRYTMAGTVCIVLLQHSIHVGAEAAIGYWPNRGARCRLGSAGGWVEQAAGEGGQHLSDGAGDAPLARVQDRWRTVGAEDTLPARSTSRRSKKNLGSIQVFMTRLVAR